MHRILLAVFCAVFLVFCSVCSADDILDINSASVQLLAERLPGIGPAKARAIVTHREENGSFTSVDALIDVRGIGPATLEKIRPLVQAIDNLANTGQGLTLKEKESRARIAVRAVVDAAKQDKP
jgi:competence protein ComEA